MKIVPLICNKTSGAVPLLLLVADHHAPNPANDPTRQTATKKTGGTGFRGRRQCACRCILSDKGRSWIIAALAKCPAAARAQVGYAASGYQHDSMTGRCAACSEVAH